MANDTAARDRRRPQRPQRGVQLTERDRSLLSFMAEHRLVLSGHVQAQLGISARAAYARLYALRRGGFVTGERHLYGEPGCYQITRTGLTAIASDLPAPRAIDLSCYRHDVGLAWLFLAARDGAFGPLRTVISERRMRSQDRRTQTGEERFGVRLGGVGPRGGERLHYPDLILDTQSGHRAALELELSPKSRSRREGILAGYGADARIDAVVYLVEKANVGRAVKQSASRLGISALVHVQPVALGLREAEPPARGPVRAPAQRGTALATAAGREGAQRRAGPASAGGRHR